MARRTKEDALATRESILDAAEMLFEQQGVSRTTLQHIATAAGVTRGAIYWHFADKSALFNALLERISMPLEAAMQAEDALDPKDPVADLRKMIFTCFELVSKDDHARRIFEIFAHKVEYVDELLGVKARHVGNFEKWLKRAEHRIRLGMKSGVLREGLPVRQTALGLLATMDGLMRMWLLSPGTFDLHAMGKKVIDAQLDALYALPPAMP